MLVRNLFMIVTIVIVLWLFQIFGTMFYMVFQDTDTFSGVDLVWFLNYELTPFFWGAGVWGILFIAAAIFLIRRRMKQARNRTI